ncbi:ABC transporter ATP-binding protein [Loigolactobacillus bifermentans]|nr:ABC transporter ATP-binding protein [Loigolactobacillus bifermentans]
MYLEINQIAKNFKQQTVLKEISFGVKAGSLTALLGPSGSGKTTLLRILAGLETPTTGDVAIDGQVINRVKPQDRGIGFVFQNYALFRYLTVYDNIAFGLRTQHWSEDKIKARVDQLLAVTGLTALAQRYPNQLSGGQKQRVAFVRAIAPNPKVLFLDEPFAALDTQIRQELRGWLKQVIHQMGITSIFVTHDHTEAIEIADEIVVMNDGRVEQIGTPADVYNQPASQFVAEFIGHSSLLESPQLAGYQLPTAPYQVQIRPEQVAIFKKNEPTALPTQTATVKHVTFCGALINVELDLNGQRLFATRQAQQAPLLIGETVQLTINRLVLFKDNVGHAQHLQPLQPVRRSYAL